MDYLNVGANGFAQVGSDDYYAKNRFKLSYLLGLIEDKFPIPDKLKYLCHFAKKAFPHDFGTYHEIVLIYDDQAIGEGFNEEDEEDVVFYTQEEILFMKDNAISMPEQAPTLHDIFWDWFHEVESFDMETEEITQAIKDKYIQSLNTEKGEHLQIVRA